MFVIYLKDKTYLEHKTTLLNLCIVSLICNYFNLYTLIKSIFAFVSIQYIFLF